MSWLIKKWNAFWFNSFDPYSASVFRIFLGGLITVIFILNAGNWERFYGAECVLSLNEEDLIQSQQDWLCLFYWTEDLISISVWWWVGVVAALAFTLGWQTRLATIILYALQTSMVLRNLSMVNGEDQLCRLLLFYICFAPLNRCLSLDSYFLKEKNSEYFFHNRFPLFGQYD